MLVFGGVNLLAELSPLHSFQNPRRCSTLTAVFQQNPPKCDSDSVVFSLRFSRLAMDIVDSTYLAEHFSMLMAAAAWY